MYVDLGRNFLLCAPWCKCSSWRRYSWSQPSIFLVEGGSCWLLSWCHASYPWMIFTWSEHGSSLQWRIFCSQIEINLCLVVFDLWLLASRYCCWATSVIKQPKRPMFFCLESHRLRWLRRSAAMRLGKKTHVLFCLLTRGGSGGGALKDLNWAMNPSVTVVHTCQDSRGLLLSLFVFLNFEEIWMDWGLDAFLPDS